MGSEDDKILLVITLPRHLGARPSLDAAATALGLETTEFDLAFGIIPIAPDRQMFAAKLPRKHLDRESIGPEVSDPKITPFGD